MGIIRKFEEWATGKRKRCESNGIKFSVYDSRKSISSILDQGALHKKHHILDIRYFLSDLSNFLNKRKYQFMNNWKDLRNNDQPYNVSIYDSNDGEGKIITLAKFRLSMDNSGESIPKDVEEDIVADVKKYFGYCSYKYLNSQHGIDLYKVTGEQFDQRGYIIFDVCLNTD